MIYIYFITSNDEKFVKVGYTRDYKKRIKQLQTAQPQKLKILHILSTSDENYELVKKTEKFIHAHLMPVKSSGEWFYILKGTSLFLKNIHQTLKDSFLFSCEMQMKELKL